MTCLSIPLTRLLRQPPPRLQLWLRVGISHNKLLAKLASAMNKPNKQTVVPARVVPELMASLPFRKIRGLGGKLGDAVEELGCITAADVQQLPFEQLRVALGDFKRAECVPTTRARAPRRCTCSRACSGQA